MSETAYGEQEIEQDIQAKGLNAPRLTPDVLDAKIAAEQYHVFPGTTLTVCCLTLENGFTVTGQSAAASPGNFDEEMGSTRRWAGRSRGPTRGTRSGS